MLRRTQDTPFVSFDFVYRGLTFSAALSHVLLLSIDNQTMESYNPMVHAPWFGLFPVRSPLLRESIFLSLPAGT